MFLMIIFDSFQQLFWVPPSCQMLLLFCFQDDIATDTAFSRIAVALNSMGSCLIYGHDLITVWTSDFFDFFILRSLILGHGTFVITAEIVPLVIDIYLGEHSTLGSLNTFCSAKISETSRRVIQRLLGIRIITTISRGRILTRRANFRKDLSGLGTLHCTHHFVKVGSRTEIYSLKGL